jgi:hypothetical protein
MLETLKQIWAFIVEHYYRDALGFELTCWFLGWLTMELCAFVALGWALRRWMPQLDKALDRLELWWREDPEA